VFGSVEGYEFAVKRIVGREFGCNGRKEMTQLTYRDMQPGEQTEAYNLIYRVFKEFIAPDFSQQGIDEFLSFASPESLAERAQANNFVILVLYQKQIVGMIEIRDYDHISLLFVDAEYQGSGIGTELIERSLGRCHSMNPGLDRMSVNSGPNSVTFYEKVGFLPIAPEQEQNGIRFVPMVLSVG